MKIKFGTSGWRAIISEDFTFDNVRRLSKAVSGYLRQSKDAKKGIIVGHDSRFLSSDFAKEAARVIASCGIKVYFPQRPTPTPAIAFSIIKNKLGGGVIISASHNPPEYNGFKFSSSEGGPSSKEVTKTIEKKVAGIKPGDIKFDEARIKKNIKIHEPRKDYLKALDKVIDVKTLKSRRMHIGVDCMNGIATGYLDEFLRRLGYKLEILHKDINPDYAGREPDPSPENLKDLIKTVKTKKLNLGLAVDGDSDRFGIIDKNGHFLLPNKIIALLLYYLLKTRKKMPRVARSVSTTHLVDKIAADFGVEVVETPIGFKYIARELLSGECLFGAEESGGLSIAGHVPEKDGILANLLVVEAVSYFKKPIAEVLKEIYSRYGYYYNKRINLKMTRPKQEKFMSSISKKPPKRIAQKKVASVNKLDGYKFILEDGSWLMFRPSGTEPMIRCYIESTSKKGFEGLVSYAQKII